LKVGRLRGMKVQVFRPPVGEPISVFVAERFADRLRGLAGLADPPAATGLLIPRCRSVHTFGMRFAIDILFVVPAGGALQVRDERLAVPPRRVVRASPEARADPRLAALELPIRC
jgi:hypothetical protein